MLIPLVAGVLSALCVWFSWRAFGRCRAIQRSMPSAVERDEQDEPDELERELLSRERNLQLGLAKRNVQALGRAALFGGTGSSFWALTGRGKYDLVQLVPAFLAFAAGLLGWAACAEIHRRVGSTADSWRTANNRARRRPTTRSGPV